ncbi:MAG: carbon-phosphorus lyase [Desulfobulbaceae bacterium]|nr:MAG: carbon-phosphorus lyase [Desulfobulbaceae bacterium]
MSYVAIKGGGRAIQGAEELLEYLRCEQGEGGLPLDLATIKSQLRFLHGRVMAEGGLYHPDLAALAIKQFMGDSLEASFALRAYRSTKPRLAETPCLDTGSMRLVRRISSAFKDIPGGQMLGASTDFSLRLLRMELLDESPERFQEVAAAWLKNMPADQVPDTFPKVLDHLRQEGLLPQVDIPEGKAPFDITREPLIFPVPRSAALATMSRAETGSLLALAYSNMRGYGDIHPTVAEMRVGYLPMLLPHPISGEAMEVGEVLITECEVVAMYEENDSGGTPHFTLGYGACFGHNEVKALAMAVLDRSLQKGMKGGPANPSEDPEFVLLHVDGIDSMGFCTHYKMPHYVTFQSDMDRLRTTQQNLADHKGQEVTA